jgi:hypothetical protein
MHTNLRASRGSNPDGDPARALRRSIFGALVLSMFAACAGQDDVDRTQANRLPKSMFDGTWYVRTTVTDVPGTSEAAFIGQTGALEKIRWEIHEDLLIAYRAYQEIPGTDVAASGRESQEYRENPVAAFAIESHFDIKREYNPSTGEQTNVIVENTSDRPWHERQYMRVDWSKSQVDMQQFYGATGGVNYNAVLYVQEHEDGPDAMRVIARDGNRVRFDDLATIRDRDAASWKDEVAYFDMVGRFLLEPEKVSYPLGDGSFQQVPLCYFIRYGGRNHQTSTCGPAEVKVRTAFLRAGDRNFEPVPMPDRDLAKFGYFRTERFTYDRRYGFTEAGRIYLANVHNIWERAFETNEDGTYKIGDDGNYVRIPAAARTPKPVVYHLSDDYPCELIGTAQQIAGSWNRAMRRTVAVAKGKLSRTTGESDAEVAAIPLDEVPNMFVLDLNGWAQKTAGDDWSCSNLEYDESRATARLGDLRYSFLAWVPDRQITGPLGYGPSSADPETGEIIAGMAYVYGAAVDEYANRALEIVRTLNGDLGIDDVATGEYVREYIETQTRAVSPTLLPAEAAALRAEDIRDHILTDAMKAKIDALRAGGLEPAVLGAHQHRLDLLTDTPYEHLLLDEEVVRGMATRVLADQPIGPGDQIPRELEPQLSPLRFASPEARALDELRRDMAAKKTIWLAEFSDDSVQGLAVDLWNKHHKNGDAHEYDAMWQELRELIFRGVMEHEIGHTLGLRHNFAGSYDSINFFDRYWELRAQPDSEGNGGIKARDPLNESDGLTLQDVYAQAHQNEQQISGRMREYQYSSIMDYGAKFNSDVHGIGKYDEAAILFGYGGYVEVFDAIPAEGARVLRSRYNDCKPRFESAPSVAYAPFLESWHYTSAYNLLGGTEGLATRRFARWSDMREQQQQSTKACEEHLASGGQAGDFARDVDGGREVEVPYMFCSDEFADATVSCHRWDEGADPLEIVRNAVDSYESYYFFNNYKRGRFGFDAYSVYQRTSSRYFSYLTNTYQHWLFRVAFYGLDDITLENYWTLGTFSGFNLLMDVISKPEYGTYCRADEPGGDCREDGRYWVRVASTTTPTNDPHQMVIDRGIGRRRYSRYDFDSGYYYQNQMLEAGHFWEYLAAIEALTASNGVFVGVETGADFTRYLVPYYIVFEDELTRFFEGAITDDYSAYAPRVVDQQVQPTPAATLTLNNGTRLDPGTGRIIPAVNFGAPIWLDNNFTLKFYTLLQGMSEFRSLYSLRFADRQQVFRMGTGEEVTPGGGKEVLTCQDPIGGHVYGTIYDPAAPEAEQGSSVRMMRQCQTQAERYAQLNAASPSSSDTIRARAELSQTVEWLNFLRGLYDVFGRNI